MAGGSRRSNVPWFADRGAAARIERSWDPRGISTPTDAACDGADLAPGTVWLIRVLALTRLGTGLRLVQGRGQSLSRLEIARGWCHQVGLETGLASLACGTQEVGYVPAELVADGRNPEMLETCCATGGFT
jgi:hypothetical protein